MDGRVHPPDLPRRDPWLFGSAVADPDINLASGDVQIPVAEHELGTPGIVCGPILRHPLG